MTTSLPLDQVKQQLKAEAQSVEAWLATCLSNPSLFPSLPSGLQQAMKYSLMAGGKRIRPVLCLATARMFGLEATTTMPFAAAIECIHTYSLIHDDLPAMDDDDLRRGKPSNHKQFTEATAILAGDALLTDAFAFMASIPHVPAGRTLKAIQVIAKAAGSSGMVGGQFLDMAFTAQTNITLEQLAKMHSMKTGALLCAPCVTGAILAGATNADINSMAQFGTELGAAFQIMDDILDLTGTEEELGKPIGSDEAMNKTTYPSLLGIQASKDLATTKAYSAKQAIAHFTGADAAFLQGLADYIVNRVS